MTLLFFPLIWHHIPSTPDLTEFCLGAQSPLGVRRGLDGDPFQAKSALIKCFFPPLHEKFEKIETQRSKNRTRHIFRSISLVHLSLPTIPPQGFSLHFLQTQPAKKWSKQNMRSFYRQACHPANIRSTSSRNPTLHHF